MDARGAARVSAGESLDPGGHVHPALPRYAVGVFLTVLFLLAGTALWAWAVRKRVAVRTAGLQAEIQRLTELEEELTRSRRVITHILNSIPQAVFWKDTDGVYQGCNDVLARELGVRDTGEILGKTDFELPWPRSEAEAYRADDCEVMECKIPKRHIVEPLQRLDGTRIWVDTTKIPLVDETGRTYGVLGVCEDITERRRAELSLQHSERLLRAVIDADNNCIYLKDRDGRYLLVNKTIADLYGTTPEEMVGKTDEDFMGGAAARPRELGKFRDDDTEVLRQQKTKLIPEESFTFSDGSMRWFQTSKIPVSLAGGAEAVLGVSVDITQRKQAEEALREREERLELALRGADLGTWDWNVKTSVVRFSRRWAGMLGCAPDELRPHYSAWEELLHPEDRFGVLAVLQAHLAGNTTSFEAEFRMRHKSGRWIWILSRGKVIERDAEGTPVRATGTHLDITERRRMEEVLQQSQKMEAIGTLAGGIAHDFNNILGGVLGFAEVATDDLRQGFPVDGYLGEIIKLANRARDLTSQILTFSRKTVPVRKPLLLASLVQEAVKMVRATTPASIRIRKEIDGDAGVIVANQTQIHQVLMNLCTNAVQAMGDAGGALTIHVSRTVLDETAAAQLEGVLPGVYAKLQVRDTGTGISPDIEAHIFEPFFTTKQKCAGTGMGLSVVYGIVKQHRGGIQCESSPGRGTVFTILLPVVDGAHEPAETVQPGKGPPPGGAERILFVDDEQALVAVAQRMLSSLGYQVTAVVDSTEALALFQANPLKYDLVITDQAMPDLTGFVMAQQMLHIRPDTPVILCTGHSETVSPQTVRAAGIRAFVLKPFSRDRIAATIREVLDRRTD